MLIPLLLAALLAAPGPGDEAYEAGLQRALERAFPGDFEPGQPPYGDRLLFEEALASEAFLHEALGPLDLYVYRAGELTRPERARAVLREAADGLQPLASQFDAWFDRPQGLISGHRFPVVLAWPTTGVEPDAFDELVALLDWCEADYTGWMRDNGTLWTAGQRDALFVRTWEVLLIDLRHGQVTAQGEAFLQHGLGYTTLAHLVHRLLRLGSWGLVPPWLDQGLIDELDIQAYGRAWVGGEEWVEETEGWFRPGWSGFLPEGARPPPPVTGPPADLATTVRDTGDPWASRANSPQRHWHELQADLSSSHPASLQFMAEHESFLPRDRALARCVVHLLLACGPEQRPGLLERLDRQPGTLPGGMFDSDPLPSIVSDLLGGVPAVQQLAELPAGEKLERLGEAGLAARIRELGGAPALDLADHREQGEWLLRQEGIDRDARGRLFDLFLTAEHAEQLADWRGLGAALDQATRAALRASPSFPESAAARRAVQRAFLEALGG